MHRRTPALLSSAATIVVLALTLAGCGSSSTPPPSASGSPIGAPASSPPASPSGGTTGGSGSGGGGVTGGITTGAPTDPDVPSDAVLVITAVAHIAKESTTVRMVVLRSTAWDDASAKDRPALMSQVCGGALDAGVYEQNLWSFSRALVTTGAPWPNGLRVDLRPTADHLAIAAETDQSISDDDGVDAATPYCKRDKLLQTQGDSSIVVGFQGDTDAVGAAGGFTKWANHPWGFAVMPDATLTDCHATLTPLGQSLRAQAAASDWSLAAGTNSCIAGYQGTEDDDS